LDRRQGQDVVARSVHENPVVDGFPDQPLRQQGLYDFRKGISTRKTFRVLIHVVLRLLPDNRQLGRSVGIRRQLVDGRKHVDESAPDLIGVDGTHCHASAIYRINELSTVVATRATSATTASATITTAIAATGVLGTTCRTEVTELLLGFDIPGVFERHHVGRRCGTTRG
jgi:hypothetical protein